MKHSLIMLFLLNSIVASTQTNDDELSLENETQFELTFTFQYQNQKAFTITFFRQNNSDNIRISDSECQTNNIEQLIVDKSTYKQMLDYLQDINITTFQPISSEQTTNSKLQINGMINIERTWTLNAFVFQYNPTNATAENKMLDFIVKVLKDNAKQGCSTIVAEQLSVYINGND